MVANAANSDLDLIIPLSTPCLAAVCAKVKDKPVVFACVIEPVGAGAGKSFTDHLPNVTGAAMPAPMEAGFAWLSKLYPHARKMGAIYNAGEANSRTEFTLARQFTQARGIELIARTVSSPSEVPEALNSLLAEQPDLYFLMADSTLASAQPIIADTCRRHAIPIITADDSCMGTGALLACGISPYGNGYAGGQKAIRVLLGESPAAMPFEPSSQVDLSVDLAAAAQLGITLPPELLKESTIFHHVASRLGRPARIALVNLVQNPDLDLAEQGLWRGGLVEGRDFALKTLNAQGDMTTLSSIMAAVRADEPDLLLTITTVALQAALRQSGNLRIVFTGVADGVQAGAGKSETDHLPNVTGITTRSPFEGMAKVLRVTIPSVRRVGTLFTPSEVNSLVYMKALKEALKAENIELATVPVTSTTETVEATTALCRQPIDAVCQISDNTTRPGFSQIARKAADAGLPVFAFDSTQLKDGAVLALARDYRQAGLEACELAVRVLRGESPASIPFSNTRSEALTINPAAAKRVGLTFPPSVLQNAAVFEPATAPAKR